MEGSEVRTIDSPLPDAQLVGDAVWAIAAGNSGIVSKLCFQACPGEIKVDWGLTHFDGQGNPIGGGTSGGIVRALDSGEFYLDLNLEPSRASGSPFAIPLWGQPWVHAVIDLRWESLDRDTSAQGCWRVLLNHADWLIGLAPILLQTVILADQDNLAMQMNLLDVVLSENDRIPVVLQCDSVEKSEDMVESDAGSQTRSEYDFINYIEMSGYRGFASRQRLCLSQPDGINSGSGMTVVVGANNAGKSALWEGFDAIARSLKGHMLTIPAGRRNSLSSDGILIEIQKSSMARALLRSERADSAFTVFEVKSAEGQLMHNTHEFLGLWALPARRQFDAYFGQVHGTDLDWSTRSGEYSRSAVRNEFVELLVNIYRDGEKLADFNKILSGVLGYDLQWGVSAQDSQHGQSFFLSFANRNGTSHSSEGLGEGVVNLLFIIATLFLAEPGRTVVIDEPEISLHPQLVKRLRRLIADKSTTVQIVIFTHSPLLVEWNELSGTFPLARVFKDKNGSSSIAQPKQKTLAALGGLLRDQRNVHVLGQVASEALFLEDKVLLVEGQDDAYYLPEIFGQLGKSLNFDIWGWGIGGETKLITFMRLLKDLGYTKVMALLDKPQAHKVDEFSDRMKEIGSEFPAFPVAVWPAEDIRTKKEGGLVVVRGVLNDRKVIDSEFRSDAESVVDAICSHFES